ALLRTRPALQCALPRPGRLPLDWASSLHDFCLTPRYAVFYLAPYLLDMESLAGDGRTLMGSLSWVPELGSRLLVVSRESGEAVAEVPLGDRYSLHTINGFEEGSRLIVDVVELDRPVYDQYQEIPDLFTDVGPGRPVRLVLDLDLHPGRGALVERREIAYDRAPDFPAIDPRRFGRAYDDLWLLGISAQGKPGRKFFDQVVPLSWSSPESADLRPAPARRHLRGRAALGRGPRG